MNVKWSPHAEELLGEIIDGIAYRLYPEDAIRWNDKIIHDTNQLADCPELGVVVPATAFAFVPPNHDRLRQLIIKPYRAVYEQLDGEIHILSVRHCRQLLRETDTFWNDAPDEDFGADPDDLIYRS